MELISRFLNGMALAVGLVSLDPVSTRISRVSSVVSILGNLIMRHLHLNLSWALCWLEILGVPHQAGMSNLPQWQNDKQNSLMNHGQPDRHGPISAMIPGQQFIPHAVPPLGFAGPIPPNSSVPPVIQQHPPNILQQPPPNVGEKLPTYPLFPPGLIPGMVKKQQIGSGVPYSPMSPLDIPTIIPPSDTPESELLERVSKFFKEIGEVNPSEGPMNGSEGRYEDDYERVSPVRKGGACIPPPPNLQTDGNTDPVSFGGSGRLGLGASSTPSEGSQGSQYDDVYGSYRKQRSTNYHTSMSRNKMKQG